MRTSIGVRSFCADLLILTWCCAVGLGQTAEYRTARPNRIGPINEAQVVTLQGNRHPLAREEFDRGAVGAETRLERMVLLLEPSAAQQAELDALVAAQSDPHSPLYRQWLTPAEYGARFGAGAEEIAGVATWLEGHGFTVEKIPAGNRLIVFSGNAGEVAEAFHTEIHRFVVEGAEHIANFRNPRIPAALAGVVSGPVSLHDFRRRSEIGTRTPLATDAVAGEGPLAAAQPLYTSGSTHYLFPADWATIYDLNPLYVAGTTGVGTSTAIAGRSNIDLSDVAAFRTIAGLAAKNPTVILAGANPGLVAGDQDEATLDVEWSGAVAPDAAVTLAAAGSTATTDGVDLAAEYIVNHALAPVVSVSYGSCEQQMGTAELAFYNSLWEQAASEGMSVLVASGDAGAAGCYEGSAAAGSGTAVNGLCTSPYATCVGGTEFDEGSNPAQYWAATNAPNYGTALGYIPEEVWNESGLNGGSGLWASGGGASTIYAQPQWQMGLSGANAANGMRAVPDISAAAAAHDGYVIYENGSYYVVSGTSAASPSLAGVMALVVERQGGTGVGNANPGLYSLSSAAHSPFHPTPSGDNSVLGVKGFTASGAEYNLATGLGSVDGALLVNEWVAGGAADADFSLTASAAGGRVVAGQTATFAVSVTESGTAKHLIALTAKAPSGVTIALHPASILPGTAAIATVAVGATAALGTQNVTLAGSDASGTQTLTYALTVQPAAILLQLLPASLAAGTVGTPYLQTAIQSSGGTPPYTFAVSSGALPMGLMLSKGGLLSGVPAAAGSFPFTVTATDSSTGGGPHTGYQSFTIAIGPAAATDFTIEVAGSSSSSATVLAGGTVGESFTVSPAGGAGVFANAITLTASGLPAGASAVFSPASIPAGSGKTTVTLAIQLARSSADSEWARSGLIAGRLPPLFLALILLPLAGKLRRASKRIGRLISALLLAIAGMAATNGCGSFNGSAGQAARTYTVTVTATSGALSHSATIVLTIE